MLMVKNFCCGLLPLKPGCFVISSVGLILGISTWAYNLGNSGAYTRGASVNLFSGTLQTTYWGGWYAFILALILEILVWVALLLGAILNKHQLVLGSLIGLLITIILRMILFIVIFADPVLRTYWNIVDVGFLIVNILFFLATGLYVYFGVVVFSYYQTLKGGSGLF